MKKIFFTLSLLAGFTVAQAQTEGVADSLNTDNPKENVTALNDNVSNAAEEVSCDPKDQIEVVYKDLEKDMRLLYKKSSNPDADFLYESLCKAVDRLKNAILATYPSKIDLVWVPDPELEKLKETLKSKEEQYNKQMADIEWFEEAEATFVKVVKDCLAAKHPSKDQIRHAKAAAELLSDEYKELKDEMSRQ